MQFFEQQLENVDQGQAFIAVFSETPYNPNPLPAVDHAIQNYVNDNSYNAYVEEWLDNPWLKVVILGINNLHYDCKLPHTKSSAVFYRTAATMSGRRNCT